MKTGTDQEAHDFYADPANGVAARRPWPGYCTPERPCTTALFQLGNFALHSGATAGWKIECDALTAGDWAALAQMAAEILPPFRYVKGVPRGGTAFALALWHYAGDEGGLLIADDVCTTGASMEAFKAGSERNAAGNYCLYRREVANVQGVVVFARGECPSWVTPLFRMAR